MYRNVGDFIVLHASFKAQLAFATPEPKVCNREAFNSFKRDVTFNKEGPILAAKEGRFHTFSVTNPYSPGDVLYLSASVRWNDETGTYQTDYFEYLLNGLWHSCGVNNGERKLNGRDS